MKFIQKGLLSKSVILGLCKLQICRLNNFIIKGFVMEQSMEFIIYSNLIILLMSQSQYHPKHCAFHTKQHIFNFCKNRDCLLPLCPSCVKVHTEQHKTQNTYGQFENIHKVVNDLDTFFSDTVKQLNCYTEQIKELFEDRAKQQGQLKKKIYEARVKMVTLVQRFFNDFEKEVSKSVIAYNDSMKQNYGKVESRISQLKNQLQTKNKSLGSQKVLKTIIGFHAKNQQTRFRDELDLVKSRMDQLGEQKVAVICQPNVTQTVIDQLGSYIHLSFLNWQNQIKYVSEFVKTGFSSLNNSTGNSFYTEHKT